MVKFLMLGTVAVGLGTIAIFSVQNASPTVISFLMFQSVALPLGVVLTASVMVGLFIPLLLLSGPGQRS